MNRNHRLLHDEAVLCIVDVQEKLVPVMRDGETLIANLQKVIAGAKALQIPILITEQYVRGLGSTVTRLQEGLGDSYAPIEKMCFSSFGCDAFRKELERLRRRQVLLCGIETHVCVYQTAVDLLAEGYTVHLVADGVSSRSDENRQIAIQRLMAEGAKVTSVEMALFEMTVTSGTDEFRAISKIVK